jgi:hypothetical protein
VQVPQTYTKVWEYFPGSGNEHKFRFTNATRLRYDIVATLTLLSGEYSIDQNILSITGFNNYNEGAFGRTQTATADVSAANRTASIRLVACGLDTDTDIVFAVRSRYNNISLPYTMTIRFGMSSAEILDFCSLILTFPVLHSSKRL